MMKKLTYTLIFLFAILAAKAQDTLKYNYAILNVSRIADIATVEYDNGFTEDLWKKLNLSHKQTRHYILFRCFEYLNDSRYDLTSAPFDTGNLVPDGTVEYIFKRKKK